MKLQKDWMQRIETVALSALVSGLCLFGLSGAAYAQTNLITNPSFDAENYDTQTPSGWSEWEGDANWNTIAATSSYTETTGGSPSGARHGTHWKGSGSYRIYTYQTKTGLANGLYTARIKAKRGNGVFTQSQFEVKDYGGSTRWVNIPSSSTYQTLAISDINVSNGQATVGIWTDLPASTTSGRWVYFDDVEFFKQDAARVATKVRFYPRSGYAYRMVGGKFQGSNNTATTGYTDLVTVSSTPADNAWTELTFTNSTQYRYYRYYSPTNSYGNVAEIEFYAGSTKLTGTGFGTSGSFNNSGNDYTKTLDSNTSTFYDAASASDQYVGIDTGGSGGTTPPPANALKVYMLGNSLTDNIWYNDFGTMIGTAGKSWTLGSQRIPGAGLDWLWNHPNDGFSSGSYGLPGAGALRNYTWDVVTLQSFDRGLDSDMDNSDGSMDDRLSIRSFMNETLRRTENANTQFYSYQRWVGKDRANSYSGGNYMTHWDKPYVPGTYTSSEQTRDFFAKLVPAIRADYPNLSKPFRIIPSGDVLYEVDKRARNGQIPGLSTVWDVYADDVHLNNVGAFIVGTTAYATIWKTSPIGLSYATYDNKTGTGDRDITDGMASAIQQAAWDVVSNHNYAGVKAGS